MSPRESWYKHGICIFPLEKLVSVVSCECTSYPLAMFRWWIIHCFQRECRNINLLRADWIHNLGSVTYIFVHIWGIMQWNVMEHSIVGKHKGQGGLQRCILAANKRSRILCNIWPVKEKKLLKIDSLKENCFWRWSWSAGDEIVRVVCIFGSGWARGDLAFISEVFGLL